METVILAIIAAAPALTAIGSIIVAVIKLVKTGKATNKDIIDKMNQLEQSVLDTKEYQTLKEELVLAHQENRALKKAINELLTKIDHIARGEEDGENEQTN